MYSVQFHSTVRSRGSGYVAIHLFTLDFLGSRSLNRSTVKCTIAKLRNESKASHKPTKEYTKTVHLLNQLSYRHSCVRTRSVHISMQCSTECCLVFRIPVTLLAVVATRATCNVFQAPTSRSEE